MQYRSRCNIFNSFGNALLFRHIYKGRLVQISENIAFLFYKEIYMKYLILYYKIIYIYFILHTLSLKGNLEIDIRHVSCVDDIYIYT
jgi:hypothetical protein